MTATALTYHCPHCGTAVSVEPRSSEEVLNCPVPTCGKPFRVEVPTAEPARNVVLPSETASAAPVETAPLAVEKTTAEEEVGTVHLDILRRYPFRCLGYALLVVAGLIAGVVAFVQGWPWLGLVCFTVAGFVAARFALWWWRIRHTALKFTNQRCILESGILTRQSTELPLADITTVEVRQGPLTRFLNVGDLVLMSERGDVKQMVLMAVPDPQAVAAQIQTAATTTNRSGAVASVSNGKPLVTE